MLLKNQGIWTVIIWLSLSWCCLTVWAQDDSFVISGNILDSATRLPVPHVTVQNQSNKQGTSSQDDGTFNILCSIGDTLFFTMVGYMPKKRVVANRTKLTVLLRESFQLLKPLTVYGSFKPQGYDSWKGAVVMPKSFRNPAGPGSGYAVETFGPGYVFSGPFSRFSKSEKEKRKLKTLKHELSDTDVYRSTITSPEVKEYFQKTFSLSETEYSKKIERFNLRYPEAAFLTSKEEIMKMLVGFFAIKED